MPARPQGLKGMFRSLVAWALEEPGPSIAALVLFFILLVPAMGALANPWTFQGGAPPARAPAAEPAATQPDILAEPEPDPSEPHAARCRDNLQRSAAGVLSIADLSRNLSVDRQVSRNATIREENAILLKAMGWVPGVHGNLSDVQDYVEVETLTCRFTQVVALEENDVLAALTLTGPLGGRPGIEDLARLDVTLTLLTTTTHQFHLDEGTVLATLSLARGGFDPARLSEIATVSRESHTDRSYRQDVTLDPDLVIAALAGSGSRSRDTDNNASQREG